MSLLLIGLEDALADQLVGRLVAQADEVRVLVPERAAGERWRALGAFIAVGVPGDADLMERAAQNVRTLVVAYSDYLVVALDPLLEGARLAGVSRMVVTTDRPRPEVAGRLKAWGFEYVILVTRPPGRFFKRRSLPTDEVAEAIDAADDLAGPAGLEIYLSRSEDKTKLGL